MRASKSLEAGIQTGMPRVTFSGDPYFCSRTHISTCCRNTASSSPRACRGINTHVISGKGYYLMLTGRR